MFKVSIINTHLEDDRISPDVKEVEIFCRVSKEETSCCGDSFSNNLRINMKLFIIFVMREINTYSLTHYIKLL